LAVREETKRLLDRLGQPDFNYREYKDDASDDVTLRWPLFELVERQLVKPVVSAPVSIEVENDPFVATENDLKSLINRISSGRTS